MSKIDLMPLKEYAPHLDARKKLTESDIDLIKELYGEGEAIKSIARIVGVSKRTVHFKLFPERLEACLAAGKARGGSGIYYNKERNTIATRRLRAKKREEYKKMGVMI